MIDDNPTININSENIFTKDNGIVTISDTTLNNKLFYR